MPIFSCVWSRLGQLACLLIVATCLAGPASAAADGESKIGNAFLNNAPPVAQPSAQSSGDSLLQNAGGLRRQINQQGFATVYIQFALNSAEILSESFAQANELTVLLQEEPTWCLHLVGHTDATGEPAYNLELSKRRAAGVRDYLTGQGIAATRLSAAGLGAEKPVADNKTGEGRARNRRVEVIKQNCAQGGAL